MPPETLKEARDMFKKLVEYGGKDGCIGCGMKLEHFDELVYMVKKDLVKTIKFKLKQYDWGERQNIIDELGDTIVNDLVNNPVGDNPSNT